MAGSKRTSDRVSKPSARTASLNEQNIAALEHEVNPANDQAPQTNIQPAEWIQRVKELSSLPSKPQLTTSATQILNRYAGRDNISPSWLNDFIKGLPDDLKPIKAPSIKKRRIDASDQETLEHWFERLKALTAEVPPANLYNFSDTLFQIGLGEKPIKVICFGGSIPPCRTTRLYCEWMSTIECIAADGWVADPCIVTQGPLYEEWLEYLRDGDAYLFPTDGGRVTETVACGWIKFFHKKTQDRVTDGQPRIMLFPGQPQYLCWKFLQFCDQHNIILFRFPPNIGHLLQPFNCKTFDHYKGWWKKRGLWMNYEEADDEKDDFFEFFPEAREEVFKPQAIKGAFAERGIFPFDPSKVGQPL
ncbi:hypothetical protein N7535_008739 [Penicillium sp. DV-2018c]|nr:hypothetical protein N7461_002496 [Penicillium sp. DV-2018c]KAJ5563575.1 hypothetical protein N7535_008739 [Penicillium sp. DV-2018c]